VRQPAFVPPAIVVLKETLRVPPPAEGLEIIPVEALRARLFSREFPRLLFRYRAARLLTYRCDVLFRPLRQALLLRLLSRGPCSFEDDQEKVSWITSGVLLRFFARSLLDWARKPFVLRRIRRRVAALEAALGTEPRRPIDLRLSGRPFYLRTDLVFNNRAGGSVSHIAGVLNQLDTFTGPPLFLTSDYIPTVRPDLETRLFPMPASFLSNPDLFALQFTFAGEPFVRQQAQATRPTFIYQRYSRGNFCGVVAARGAGVPLVIEYNGPEVWVSRNWGQPLRYESVIERIELLNLRGADLVVVVSQALREHLVARGIDEGKILVNPNRVDADRYSPDVSGDVVRKRYGIEGKLVIGFVGTFGPWHGAEVLTDAFGILLQAYPGLRQNTRLMMIGTGTTLPLARAHLVRHGVVDFTVFTGMIPQQAGPSHLAACDVLVSPHVRNADGTKFFGSPTKLFEYMAAGKGIVASALGQISEVLEHGRTGWLVDPGDPAALAEGMRELITSDDLRRRLGRAAREEVLRNYTWTEHTRRIIQALATNCALHTAPEVH
jgi:glycosyltransferase involved in cell wall biosynthesis